MSLDPTQLAPRPAASPASMPISAVWPRTVEELPLFLTTRELAHLLSRSVRSLERDRIAGGGIPFRRIGKRAIYARADVVAFLDAARFVSTGQEKAAKVERAA